MAAVAALVRTAGWRAWPARPVPPAAVLVIGTAWLLLAVHELEPAGARHSLPVEVMGWTVMSAAMMGPAALPAMRHVALSSLRWRRSRAVAEFVAAYGALWVAFGVVALGVTSRLGPSGRLVAVALVLAALWQLSPGKQRFLRRCHRAVPLPPTGRRATLGCLRFGWVHGVACVGSCWGLMAVMAAAPAGHLAWNAVVTLLVLRERSAPRPRRAARQAALPLVVLAAAFAVAG